MSATLSAAQRRGLDKLGDILIPGDEALPSFTASGCAAHADRMLEHMYDDDRAGVTTVLSLCAILPRSMVRWLFALTEHHADTPEAVASLLRMANLGIKGVVVTLYYADVGEGRVFEALGWDTVVHQPAADDPQQKQE